MPISTDPIAPALASLRRRAGDADAAFRDWCAQLPAQVATLESLWDLTVAAEPARAGFGGIAIFVTRSNADPAVLKLTFSPEARDLENEVLVAWQGRRSVRLLERDDLGHARLLERLAGPSLSELADPVEAMAIAGELAADLAITAPQGLQRMADVAPQIAASILDASADKFGSLTAGDVRSAAATFRELGSDQPDTLLHGDLQGSNVLRAPAGGWVVIDPLGLVGEVALEALTMLRDRWTDLPAGSGRSAMLSQLYAFADAAGTPRERVIAWTHARCVRAVLSGVDDDDGMHEWVAAELRRFAP